MQCCLRLLPDPPSSLQGELQAVTGRKCQTWATKETCLCWEPPPCQEVRCLALPAPVYSMPLPTAASVPCQGQQRNLNLQRHNTTHRASLMLTCPTCSSIRALPGEEAAHQTATIEPYAVPNATLPLPLSLLSIASGSQPDRYWCPFPGRLHGACKCLVGCHCQARGLRGALQGWGLRLAQQPLVFCRGKGRPWSYRLYMGEYR